MSRDIAENKKNLFSSILSGVIVSVAITLVLILIFALFIRFFNIPDGAIFPVNQVIKIISMFIGILTALKKSGRKGFLIGLLLGLLYYVLSYIVFSLLQSSFVFNIKNLFDLLLTTIMGGLLGIIIANLIRK